MSTAEGPDVAQDKSKEVGEGVDRVKKAPRSDNAMLLASRDVLSRVWVFFCDPVVVTEQQYIEARVRLIQDVEELATEIKVKYPEKEDEDERI